MAISAACRLDSNSTRRRRTTHPCAHARNRAWSRARAQSFSTHHHTCEGTFRQWIHDSELVLTRNVCRLRAVMPTQAHPGLLEVPAPPRAPHQQCLCAIGPHSTKFSCARSPTRTPTADRERLRSRQTRSNHQRARSSAYYITRARSSRVNDLSPT